jgi:hypothetical protein
MLATKKKDIENIKEEIKQQEEDKLRAASSPQLSPSSLNSQFKNAFAEGMQVRMKRAEVSVREEVITM